DGRKRSVPPFVGIKWRDAHKSMDTSLGCEISVRIFADDIEGYRFDSGFFTVLVVEHLRLEAILLSPPQIHAHEHLGPVLSLGTPRAGMNIDDRVETVVLTREQDFRFEMINERLGVF